MADTLIVALASFGVSFALVYLDGPYELLQRLRDFLEHKSIYILVCLSCVSFWVSGLLSLLIGVEWFEWLAAWGIVVILDKLISYIMVR